MKRTFILVSILLATSTAIFAETTAPNVTQITKTEYASVTINCTEGNLVNLINAGTTPIATITELVVTGTINQVDIAAMRDDMTQLVSVDLRGATVTQCINAGTTYNANEIPKDAFSNKQTLRFIILPSDITKIGQNAFSNCQTLLYVNMPNTLTTLDNNAFQGCNSLADINLTALHSIGEGCFFACTSLSNIMFGANLRTIGTAAFMNCSAITEIILPEGLISVGSGVFTMCIGLKSLVLPATLSGLSISLFQGDISLEKIVSFAYIPPTFYSQAFTDVNLATCKLFVPVGAVSVYASEPSWGLFTQIAEYNPTAVQTVTAKTTISLNDNKFLISSDKLIQRVEIMSFDGKSLSSQQCNSSSCNIEIKGENKVIAKIVYQDGTSQTNKIVGSK